MQSQRTPQSSTTVLTNEVKQNTGARTIPGGLNKKFSPAEQISDAQDSTAQPVWITVDENWW